MPHLSDAGNVRQVFRYAGRFAVGAGAEATGATR